MDEERKKQEFEKCIYILGLKNLNSMERRSVEAYKRSLLYDDIDLLKGGLKNNAENNKGLGK